jgi:hypothetical protein
MIDICNGVRDQLVIIENEWNSRNQGNRIQLAKSWDHWIRSAFGAATDHATKFIQTWISEMNVFFTAGKELTDWEIGVRETLRAWGAEVYFLTVDLTGLHPV